MRRRLSSRQTVFFKYGFPTLWLLFLLLMLSVLGSPRTMIEAYSKGRLPYLLIFSIVVCTFALYRIVRDVAPLRFVSRDENALYVRTWQGEISVPMHEIIGVREAKETLTGNWKPLVVELRTPSPLGQEFQFLPARQSPLVLPWERQPHPILVELQAIASDNTPPLPTALDAQATIGTATLQDNALSGLSPAGRAVTNDSEGKFEVVENDNSWQKPT